MSAKRLLLPLLGGAGLLLIILWSVGVFRQDTIDRDAVSAAEAAPAPALTARAVRRPVLDYYEAVGTVRPRTQTSIEAQVTAKILKVMVNPGDHVTRGQTLIVLDSRELKSRRDQANQGLTSARAAREQAREAISGAEAAFSKAEAQYKRIKNLYSSGAVTSRELDQAEAEYLQSRAALRQARDGLAGAEASVRQAEKKLDEVDIGLGYAEIRALEDGEVVQRLAEPGDLAFPGKSLLLVQTAQALRLEALVPERLIGRIRPGNGLNVDIAALEATVTGTVEEVVPSADPLTRTFMVKVGLPSVTGLYPGMFGRLLVPAELRETVVVPAAAVQRVGQLRTVTMRAGEQDPWKTVYVTTGPAEAEGMVEILSGLTGGEEVGLHNHAAPAGQAGGGNG